MTKVLLAILFTATAYAADPSPPVFVPVGIYYVDGHIANVKAFPEHIYDSLHECQDAVTLVLAHLQGGAVMKVACMPVPSTGE